MDLAERTGSAQRHPWETTRAAFLRGLVDRYLGGCTPRRVLDVGAGDGWFAHELQRELDAGTEVVCWDVNYSGADLAADLPASIGARPCADAARAINSPV